MIENSTKNYSFTILLIFVIIEVLLFGSTNYNIQLFFSILEYLFVAVILILNLELGLMYFMSFCLLTIGLANYEEVSLSYNFYSIRIGGFSLNILFSFFVFILLLFKKKMKIQLALNSYYKFFVLFLAYSFLIGIISVFFSINYLDNFLTDFMTYFPGILYIFFISNIKLTSAKIMVKYTIVLSVFMLLLSSLLDIKSTYAGEYFTLQNSLYFILPVALIIFSGLYSRFQALILLISFFTLFVLNEYFIAGKTIIMIFIFLIWLVTYRKNLRIPILISAAVIASFYNVIIVFLYEYFAGSVVSFKLAQTVEIFNIIDFEVLAKSYTSIGNLIAEAKTTIYHLIDNPINLIFGKGLGGGIPDIFGYLSQWAGTSGYNIIDQTRNDYHKMHLPIYEVVLKSGIIGLIYYIVILYKSYINKSKYSVIGFLLLILVFYVSKEQFLLCLLILKIIDSDHKMIGKTNQ